MPDYESGYVEGYLASRGIIASAQKELQRALAVLKRHREGIGPSKARTPHGLASKPAND